MAETLDMTSGKPAPLMLRLSIPIVLGGSIDAVYSIANGAILGQFVNINAFTAFGVSTYVYWMVLCIIQGMASGFTFVFAKRFGEGDRRGLSAAAAMSFLITAVFSCLLTISGVICVSRLLTLLNTPAEIVGYARVYLQIRLAFIPAAFFCATVNALFYAAGNSRTPFAANAFSIVINVALSAFFVLATPLGIAGVALASGAGQLFASVYCAARLSKSGIIKIEKNLFKPDFSVIRPLLSVGLPLGFRDLPSAAVTLLIQQAVNGFGLPFVAGVAAGKQFNYLLFLMGESFSKAVMVYVGQNVGANNYARVSAGVKTAVKITLIVVLAMIAAVAPFRRLIIPLFITGGSAASVSALRFGLRQFEIILLMTPAYYLTLLFRGIFNGLGNGFWPMISGILEAAARVAVVFLLIPVIGEWGVYIAEPIGWPLMAGLLIIVYLASSRSAKSKGLGRMFT